MRSAKREPGPRENPTKASTLNTAVLSALAAVVASTIVALTVDRFSWEVEFTLWLQGFDLGEARFLRGWIFWMGVRGVAGAVMLAVCLLLWLRRWRLEAVFVALVLAPGLLNILIKEVIGRPRPTADLVDVVIGYGGIQGAGFPSGHAAHVVLFYGFLLYLARLYLPNAAQVRSLYAAGGVYALLTGLWLIYDGRHWLLDVIGGYAYGAFYLLALIAAYHWALNRLFGETRPLRNSGRHRMKRRSNCHSEQSAAE